jgi:hypothetical protein
MTCVGSNTTPGGIMTGGGTAVYLMTADIVFSAAEAWNGWGGRALFAGLSLLPQANAYAMIGQRATAAGIETKLGNHSFRATGITAYLKNGGTLEKWWIVCLLLSTRIGW